MNKQTTQNLFSPVLIGPLTLAHRVVMPPMTRMRSNLDDSVNDRMVEYYGQRASKGGLTIMEASFVSPTGNGYFGAPGIYADKFIAGFKRVADAIHAKGGVAFAQLWHSGRVSHTSLQPDGAAPLAPSVIPTFAGHAATSEGEVVSSPSRELKIEEIPGIVEEFRQAAERAKAAGFDGVELHGANGYLPDQFLQDNANHRTDAYGGSIENRSRFLLEVTNALISVWGSSRVGVRISPSGSLNEMADSNPDALFGYLAEQLNKLDLAYLHVIEPRVVGDSSKENAENMKAVASAQLRAFYRGKIIAAGGFTRESAETILERGDADLVAFGRYFIANPDLPERLRRNLPLNKYNRATFYGGDEQGLTDYPFYEVASTIRKARTVRFSKTGGPEVLKIEEIDIPAPGRGEVRIAVKAIGLNRSESMWRSGQYIQEPVFPARLGYEASGVIESIGEGVADLNVGDAVSLLPAFSQSEYGTYGELILAPAWVVVRHPASLTFEEAAAFWMMFLTAYGALVETAKLSAGEVVLIPGASSGVGLAAIQIANAIGAVPVALTRTSAKRQKLSDSGAAHVIATEEQDLITEVERITKSKGAEVVLDPVAGPNLAKLIEAMADHGRFVLYGALSTQPSLLPVMALLTKRPTIYSYQIFDTTTDPIRLKAATKFAIEGCESGDFKAVVDKVFSFDQVVESHRYLEANDQFGKIVVAV